MAVFTKISFEELDEFLKFYSIGKLISFDGILEGIENTNYKIITKKGTFILTIFEKRVNQKDLPFFFALQKHLSKYNFKCPVPIEDNNNNNINKIANKSAVLISFLQGKNLSNPNSHDCRQVGEMIANLKNITSNFDLTRKNGLDITKWQEIYNKCLEIKSNKFKRFFYDINNELQFLTQNWPKDLPMGIIHADLFQDNIFFQDSKLSGVIDFYFSCYDFYAYELAITTNAWCFDNNQNFNKENFISLMMGYNSSSFLDRNEKKYFNIILRGAAIRILVTRIHDYLYHSSDDLVVPKDPEEYYKILKWHQSNSVFSND